MKTYDSLTNSTGPHDRSGFLEFPDFLRSSIKHLEMDIRLGYFFIQIAKLDDAFFLAIRALI